MGDDVRAIASFCDSIAMRRVAVITGNSNDDIDFTRLLARCPLKIYPHIGFQDNSLGLYTLNFEV